MIMLPVTVTLVPEVIRSHPWTLAAMYGLGHWVLTQCAAAAVLCISVHDVHRYGMHGGFMMRQQAISAIHAKMLRLNSASIAAVSVGKVRPVLFACHAMQGYANTTIPSFSLKPTRFKQA